jgi:sugar lactone lactonase YvrE
MLGRIGCRVLLAAVLFALAMPATAGAYIYYSDGSSVGRANLDGSAANNAFIPGLINAQGVAVDGQHIFWANFTSKYIGRADLDGSHVVVNMIRTDGSPIGVATDGTHVYWADIDNNQIGRATVDGADVRQGFITGANTVEGVAVDGSHVYWNTASGYVGRANLDGTAPNQTFVPVPDFPTMVAVDAAHIYVTDFGGSNGISRVGIDGMGVTPNFIAAGADPEAVAVDAGHVYWSNVNAGTLSRAAIDGSGKAQIMSGLSSPSGLAVDALPPPNKFSFGKLKRNKKRGTATLAVDLPGPGELALTGKGLVVQRPAAEDRRADPAYRAVSGGTVNLLIKAKGRKKRKLKHTGKVKVDPTVTFTPTRGTPATQSRPLKLKKK